MASDGQTRSERIDELVGAAAPLAGDAEGDLRGIVERAYADDSSVTAEEIADIVRQAECATFPGLRREAASEDASRYTTDTAQRSGPWARRSRD